MKSKSWLAILSVAAICLTTAPMAIAYYCSANGASNPIPSPDAGYGMGDYTITAEVSRLSGVRCEACASVGSEQAFADTFYSNYYVTKSGFCPSIWWCQAWAEVFGSSSNDWAWAQVTITEM